MRALNLGKIMFHLWGTFYVYKANITHLRKEGDGKVKAKAKAKITLFGVKGYWTDGRTTSLYI